MQQRNNREDKPSRNATIVEQAVRCFMVHVKKKAVANSRYEADDPIAVDPIAAAINERCRPFGGFCLILDTETFTFKHGQKARFGAYQLRGI